MVGMTSELNKPEGLLAPMTSAVARWVARREQQRGDLGGAVRERSVRQVPEV
jgi:hypothetical protein